MALAQRSGLSGWDPQGSQTLGLASQPSTPAPPIATRDVHGTWGAKDLVGLGLGMKSIQRAWDLAALGPAVSFGEAVGCFILGLALRDGAEVDAADARRAVQEVAGYCSNGVPNTQHHVGIDFSITDVTGFAQAVAAGEYGPGPCKPPRG